MTIILFKIWATNRFSKAKSCNFHFHKNDVTWPLSANGLSNRRTLLLVRLSREENQSSRTVISWVKVEKPLRNPCWWGILMSLLEKYFDIELKINNVFDNFSGNAGQRNGSVIFRKRFVTLFIDRSDHCSLPISWYTRGVIRLLKNPSFCNIAAHWWAKVFKNPRRNLIWFSDFPRAVFQFK